MNDAQWLEEIKAGTDVGWKVIWERVIVPESTSLRSAESMGRYSLTGGGVMGLLS